MAKLFPRVWAAAVLAGVLFAPPPAHAGDAPPLTMRGLVRTPPDQLHALYAGGAATLPPVGFAPGRAIPPRAAGPASAAYRFVWQGKVFRGDGTMNNRVFGVGRALPADVYLGPSLLDGQPSLILDYSKSRLWPDVRDEVREIAPGLYLGIMYRGRVNPQPQMFFTLDARR